MTRAADRELELIVGDNSPFTMELFDDADAPEDLSAATRARLVVDTKPNSGTPLLDLQTGAELTINVASNTIDAQMTTGQAGSLVVGKYISQLAVEFGAGNWKHTDPFYTVVQPAVSAILP